MRGGKTETHTGDMLGHRKLRIDTRIKLLWKWDPRRYGDKLQQVISGDLNVRRSVQDMSDDELLAIARAGRSGVADKASGEG
jgi:hypothetical protein